MKDKWRINKIVFENNRVDEIEIAQYHQCCVYVLICHGTNVQKIIFLIKGLWDVFRYFNYVLMILSLLQGKAKAEFLFLLNCCVFILTKIICWWTEFSSWVFSVKNITLWTHGGAAELFYSNRRKPSLHFPHYFSISWLLYHFWSSS